LKELYVVHDLNALFAAEADNVRRIEIAIHGAQYVTATSVQSFSYSFFFSPLAETDRDRDYRGPGFVRLRDE
jgi:hypothetical protein